MHSLARAVSSQQWLLLAREKLDEVKRLVKQMEKPYAPDWKEWKPPEHVGVFKKGDIVGTIAAMGKLSGCTR